MSDRQQIQQNTADIQEIKTDIHTIKTNHLWHIERDMSELKEKVQAMDGRLWWILGVLVSTTILSLISDRLFF
jgi:L-lactate utilization protein LutB